MKVYLSSTCCGKSTLAERDDRFVDFDHHLCSKKLFRELFTLFYEKHKDDDICVLMHIQYYLKYCKDICSAERAFLPEISDESISFREKVYEKRSGGYKKEFTQSYKKRLTELKQTDIPITYLKPGEFLSDYLLPKGEDCK